MGVARDRQLVVRFSTAELALVRERADLAGMAVGAWVGEAALGAAEGVGLVDLLRLHADVVAAREVGVDAEDVARLLGRLDEAVDVVVAAVGRPR